MTDAAWHDKTLRSLAEINYGKSPSGILLEDGSYPVVGTGGVERYGSGYLYDGESIVLGRKGSIDRIQFMTGKFWTIDTAYYLSDFQDALPRWLFYFLETQDLRQLNEATGVPSLSRDVLYRISIPTPPPIEQSKIAEVLSTVDRAIEQTEALIAKQQRIKTGLMQDLLTRGIDEHGNLRSEQTHQFKDSPLGRIPVEWDVKQLGAVSDFVTSGARGWAKYYRQDGAIFLRIGNLTRQHINLRFNDIVYVQPPKSAEGQRTKVMPGDILISVTADLGIIGVIPEGFEKAFVNQHIALVRPDQETVDSRFVGWFFGSRMGQVQFEQQNESGAKAGLNLPTIRGLMFPSPCVEEQQLIAERLDSSVSVLDMYVIEQSKLLSLKTALMQDLLTGKRRVTALLNEVEEAAI